MRTLDRRAAKIERFPVPQTPRTGPARGALDVPGEGLNNRAVTGCGMGEGWHIQARPKTNGARGSKGILGLLMDTHRTSSARGPSSDGDGPR